MCVNLVAWSYLSSRRLTTFYWTVIGTSKKFAWDFPNLKVGSQEF